jgi:uncharacterized protein (TIGR02285 family)
MISHMLKLGSLFIFLSAIAHAATITWTFTSVNPAVSIPKANIVDENHPLFLLYKSELKGYDHVTLKATVPRIETELKGKSLVCYPGSSEAERRRQFSYLTSQYVQPSPQIVARKEIADQIRKKQKKGVSLRKVLADSSLRGLIGESRSFGASIDQIISQENGNLKTGVFDTFGPALLNMIEKHRADYTIEYPFILHNLRENAKVGLALETVPLKDVNPIITQYLACSKTPEGRVVIEKADQIIRQHVKEPKFWTGVLESIPKSDRAGFQTEIQKFSEARVKAPVIIE